MCLFFYRHSCCIKWPRGLNFCPLPGKFSGTVELSLHSSVSQSTTRCVWGGGSGEAPILYACLASVLSFIHLELEKYVLGITQTHPYGIDLYTTEWFFFFLTLILMRILEENTTRRLASQESRFLLRVWPGFLSKWVFCVGWAL